MLTLARPGLAAAILTVGGGTCLRVTFHSRPGFWAHSVYYCLYIVPGSLMVRELPRDTKGHGFDSRPFHFQATTWESCSHTCASITKQYNLVPVKGRLCPAKIPVGLASHWPCVTDGSSTYGLTG